VLNAWLFVLTSTSPIAICVTKALTTLQVPVAVPLSQLVLKMEQALSTAGATPVADAAPASPPDAPASSPGLAAFAAASAQRLPWPEDQPLPLAELLSLLYWLQQHAVRLQLAPGASADLYMDPDLEVYAAVRVPMLSMQSRPTPIGGEGTQQRQGETGQPALSCLVCLQASRTLS
jgi:hypothetical protein